MVVVFLCMGVESSNAQVIIALLLGDKLNSGKLEFGLDGGMNVSTLTAIRAQRHILILTWCSISIPNKKTSMVFLYRCDGEVCNGAKNLPLYSLGNSELDSTFAGGSMNSKTNCFNVPLLLKYKFKCNVFLTGGFQLGLNTSVKDLVINDSFLFKR